MEVNASFRIERKALRQLVSALGTIFLMRYWWNAEMPCFRTSGNLLHPAADNTLWLFLASGLHDLLMSIALPFCLLLTAGMLLLYFVSDRRVSILVLLMYALFFLLQLAHGAKTPLYLLPLLLALLPLCFRRHSHFVFAWMGMRYVALAVFWQAACWKLVRGVVFEQSHMAGVLQLQHADLLFYGEGWRMPMIEFLLGNPALAQLLFIAAFLLQFLTLAGWLTTRCDRWLVVLLSLFLISNAVLMDLWFWEMSLLLALVWPWAEMRPFYHQIAASPVN